MITFYEFNKSYFFHFTPGAAVKFSTTRLVPCRTYTSFADIFAAPSLASFKVRFYLANAYVRYFITESPIRSNIERATSMSFFALTSLRPRNCYASYKHNTSRFESSEPLSTAMRIL